MKLRTFFKQVGSSVKPWPTSVVMKRAHECSHEAMPKMDWSIANLESVKEFLMEQKSQGKFKPTFRCGL